MSSAWCNHNLRIPQQHSTSALISTHLLLHNTPTPQMCCCRAIYFSVPPRVAANEPLSILRSFLFIYGQDLRSGHVVSGEPFPHEDVAELLKEA